MSEETVKRPYLNKLQRDFIVEEEVKGIHFTGKQFRLDAVVRPKDSTLWNNKDIALGIEFKDTVRFTGNYDTKNLTKWLSQCVDYSNTKWGKYGHIFIFTCPELVGNVPPGVINNPMFIQNFMSQLGIGELKQLKTFGLSFVLNSHHRIWSETKGVEAGQRFSLIRKFGSR